MKMMMEARDGHPSTGSPKSKARTMMKINAKKATMHRSVPATEAMESGTVENATMPSVSYTHLTLPTN